jgi:TonB family protein
MRTDTHPCTNRVCNHHEACGEAVLPEYPVLARQINVKGNVRLEAAVAPDGTVKTFTVKGGHPILVDAAESAIRKWKYAPAAHESTELIEIHFDPQ